MKARGPEIMLRKVWILTCWKFVLPLPSLLILDSVLLPRLMFCLWWVAGLLLVFPGLEAWVSLRSFHKGFISSSSVQFSSVIHSCLTLWDPTNCSPPSLPVHHQLLESTQTRVCQVGDAIQPSSVVPFSSCPQSLPASGSFPMSQLFTTGGQSTGASASVLPMNIRGWFPLGLTGLISLFVFFLQNCMFMTRVDS